MKRAFATTIALSLAALAITAAAPIAVAVPAPSLTPVTTITVTEEQGFTVLLTLPSTADGGVTFTIKGTRNHAQVKASVGRNLAAGAETSAVGVGDDQDRLDIRVSAPAGGWLFDTEYQWQAVGMELGADAYASGTFMMPAEEEPPASPVTPPQDQAIKATAVAPRSKTGAVTITVTGARPGERVEGAAGPTRFREKPDPRKETVVTVKADKQGRAVITLKAPQDGWLTGEEYGWVATALDRGVSDDGTFTTPATWPGAPAKPPKAPKPPKDDNGGLSKTGV